MSHFWERFLKEGDELFNYMVNNFEKMFENDTHIRHYRVREGIYSNVSEIDIIEKLYNNDIEKECIEFIRNELKNKLLFDKLNWKPFRDSYYLSEMYFGYKKLFKFKQYYFQLGIEDECENSNCKYCINIRIPHFVAALYGWKDNMSNKLQPYKYVEIPKDNIIPEWDWSRK